MPACINSQKSLKNIKYKQEATIIEDAASDKFL